VAAGNNWGDKYAAYAATGTANGIPAVVPPSATSALKAALGSAFATLPGVPATVASAIASALNLFWPQVTFAGMIAPPVPAGGPGLIATITSILGVVGGTHTSKATEIRDALHAYTGQVTVTFPGPAVFPLF
jgi:hypothetical protein